MADLTVWKAVRKKRPEARTQAIPCWCGSRPSVLTWARSEVVITPPCHGGDRRFKSGRARHIKSLIPVRLGLFYMDEHAHDSNRRSVSEANGPGRGAEPRARVNSQQILRKRTKSASPDLPPSSLNMVDYGKLNNFLI